MRRHPGVRKLYADRLQAEGVVTATDVEAMEQNYVNALENDIVVSRPYAMVNDSRFLINFDPYRDNHWRAPADTALNRDRDR